jgi:hypothetical protein
MARTAENQGPSPRVVRPRPAAAPVTASGLTPSLARAFRVALGLDAAELAARLEVSAVHVLRCEDGDARPACGWDEWEAALMARLADRIEGRPWTEVRLPPFEAWRIRAVAGFDAPGVRSSRPPPSAAEAPRNRAPSFGADLDW